MNCATERTPQRTCTEDEYAEHFLFGKLSQGKKARKSCEKLRKIAKNCELLKAHNVS